MGGRGGAAFVGGLMQGMAQSQQQSANDELKKFMLQKAKIETETLIRTKDLQERASQGDQSAIRELLILKYPILGASGMGGQQPQQSPIPEDYGMYNEGGIPGPQQPTFPASMTGIPQMPFTTQQIVEKEVLGRPYSGVRAYEDKRIENGQEVVQQMDAFGRPIGQPARNPVKGRWEKTNIPGVFQFFDEFGNATSKVRQGEIEYDIKEITNPDQSKSFTYMPKQPGAGMGTPSQAIPQGGTPASPGQASGKQVQLTIDTTQPGWRNEIDKTLDQISRPKPQVGGMQSTPAKNAMFIDAQEWGNWYNPKTGKTIESDMTIPQAKPAGFKSVPKLSAETAGKFAAGAMTIDSHLPEINAALFPKGKFDSGLYKEMKLYSTSPELAGGTRGAEYAKKLEESAEAWLRIKTGAAQTSDELKQAARTYVGQWLSNEKTIKNTLNMLKTNIEGFVKVQDPQGVLRAMTTRQEKMIGDKKAVRLNGEWFWAVE